MSRLIERLRFSNFSSPEPNPFKSLDRVKEEFGTLRLPDGLTDEEKDPDLDSDADEDEDEDEEDDDDEDEANAAGGGYGILDYLTSCSIM
jgi:hypothetical protein